MKYIFILIISLYYISTFAQLGQTRNDIISDKGYDYMKGVTHDKYNAPYICYQRTLHSEVSGNYNQAKTFYFNDDDRCYLVMIIEPVAEINSWVKVFSAKYVNIGDNQWKDYANGIIYSVQAQTLSGDRVVSISIFYDDK